MDLFVFGKMSLEYQVHGHGDETILCFHGFGRTVRDFDVFASLLSSNQRLVAVHLFAHGKSIFPSERIEHHPLEKTEWKQLLLAFLEHIHATRFHLVGYSMGGRLCLVTLEIMHESILSVLLLAPDGLKKNIMYRFASGTALGRSMYRRIIDNPKWLFRIAAFLNKSGLLNDKLHRFVHVHLDTREKRWQVHDAWLIYRQMFPELKSTAGLIRKGNFGFHMIFGKFDSVITPKLGQRFSRLIGDDQHLHIIEVGHRLMTESTVDFIRQKKLWPGIESQQPKNGIV